MGLARYAIIGQPGEWHIEHDGGVAHTFATKEAAFEAAVTATSLAMRQGHGIAITAPPTAEEVEASAGKRS